jgi:hypothetical protein
MQSDSDSYDPLQLLKLIKKTILQQSNNQYKIAIIMEQLKLLLAYRQDNGRGCIDKNSEKIFLQN